VLMKMVVEGVMDGNLPWTLVFIGAGIAVVVEILGIPVLPFAVGLYLPVHLNTAIMIGGLVRLFFEKKKKVTEDQRKEFLNKGLLYTSGMIAGEGLVGILLAVFAVVPFGAGYLGDVLNISGRFSLGSAGSIAFFILLILSVFKFSIWNKDKKAVQ
ncbi:MAG: OPT/YSL family transporter, partial [Eubacterium callanderi]